MDPARRRVGLSYRHRMSVGGLGQVRTEVVRLFDADQPLVLAGGERLSEVDVSYETYGELSGARDNAVMVCHALTGDAHAAGWHEGDRRPGWWDNLIGPGKALDTDRLFVVCANLLGGCQGTTGPASPDPATGEPYGLRFPLLEMSDLVTVHRALLAHLDVGRLLALVGGSLGGMQVLEWTLSHPDEVANAVIVAASSRLSAQNIGFSAVGREAIMRDPEFAGGQYGEQHTNPDTGLAIARMLAHLTYLSEEAMSTKFGRRVQDPELSGPGFGIDFAVESYLRHQGDTFPTRFDALSYLYLTRLMDWFEPFTEHDPAAVAAAGTRVLVMSFDSDWRFATEHSRAIVRALEAARIPTSFREIVSPWGHDSFLLEIEDYHATVRAFLDRALQPEALS